jgi:hypothetical protein
MPSMRALRTLAAVLAQWFRRGQPQWVEISIERAWSRDKSARLLDLDDD